MPMIPSLQDHINLLLGRIYSDDEDGVEGKLDAMIHLFGLVGSMVDKFEFPAPNTISKEEDLVYQYYRNNNFVASALKVLRDHELYPMEPTAYVKDVKP